MLTLYRRHTRAARKTGTTVVAGAQSGLKGRPTQANTSATRSRSTPESGPRTRNGNLNRDRIYGRCTAQVQPSAPTARVRISEAVDKFCRECEARNLSDATLRKYRYLGNRIKEFASTR